MKAIVVNEPGPPEVLRLEEVEKPAPGTGEVLVKVALAGVNYADVGMRAGMMGGPHAMDLPYTPGFEVAGTVAAVGEGVEGVTEGDRVAAVLPSGGYAEYGVADAKSVVKVPEGVGFSDASALLVQGLTAYGVLHDSARVQQGDGVLVMAAGGGVGTLAVQLAKLAGAAPVIAVAGGREKLNLALSLGADHAFDYTGEGWIKDVMDATGGRGVDVALESVGGELGAGAYDCLAPLGRLVTFGAAGGEGLRPPDMWQLNMKGQTVSGYGGPWLRPGAAANAREAISGYLRSGDLKVVGGAAFPLEAASEAHRAIEGRRTTGKVLLRVD
ncbi:zinc-binding dehydrogenase [Rubrobacter tropicus]|uniref:Zinc-binding dehydrogenase n=1 Tax=Rubrobacter tropicus TaxID=2653851 RepID=A0A6G8Q6S0_9ACTN|nr:zinc-binding dehydrogenase [Rubrobacter tropicus]QIN82017.1 zinc-binding dehydrogenase [Rubrobacter tropicus]